MKLYSLLAGLTFAQYGHNIQPAVRYNIGSSEYSTASYPSYRDRTSPSRYTCEGNYDIRQFVEAMKFFEHLNIDEALKKSPGITLIDLYKIIEQFLNHAQKAYSSDFDAYVDECKSWLPSGLSAEPLINARSDEAALKYVIDKLMDLFEAFKVKKQLRSRLRAALYQLKDVMTSGEAYQAYRADMDLFGDIRDEFNDLEEDDFPQETFDVMGVVCGGMHMISGTLEYCKDKDLTQMGSCETYMEIEGNKLEYRLEHEPFPSWVTEQPNEYQQRRIDGHPDSEESKMIRSIYPGSIKTLVNAVSRALKVTRRKDKDFLSLKVLYLNFLRLVQSMFTKNCDELFFNDVRELNDQMEVYMEDGGYRDTIVQIGEQILTTYSHKIYLVCNGDDDCLESFYKLTEQIKNLIFFVDTTIFKLGTELNESPLFELLAESSIDRDGTIHLGEISSIHDALTELGKLVDLGLKFAYCDKNALCKKLEDKYKSLI